MKLTTALLLFTCFQVSAKVFSQTRITLKLQGTELKKVLSLIERKSSYRFLYNDETVKAGTRVDVDASNTPVTEVLDKLFANRSLSYKILENNLVVITGKNIEVQETKVTGKITSSLGEALQGVSIKVKGSSLGTQTDAGGNFALTVPDNAVLVISSIGYTTQEVSVSGRTSINVVLAASTSKLDEVVVIGYGTANKRDLTGSIVKIDGKEVADKPNTNPVASLQGKVAGLSIVNNGTPGYAPDIRIRGTVSIGQVHPLYVVDGILQDNIDYINTNDIESIEVLKDPSSLAIFGVRGATGAIVITTKKAKGGTFQVNFNTTFGFKKLVDKIKMADASQFNTLFAEENANNNVPTPNYTALTGNTDWINAVTRTGKYSASNLSISSSTEKNKFNMGLGYMYDEGLIVHEKLDRMLLSFSDELKINNHIKVGINLNVTHQNDPYTYNGANNSILNQARQVMPQVSNGTKMFKVANPYTGDSVNIPVYSGLATALQNSGVVNPVLQSQNTYNKDPHVEDRQVGSVYAEINFLKSFTFRSSYYVDQSTTDERIYNPLYYAYNPINNTPYLYNTTTGVTQTNNSYKKFQQDQLLTFKKSFGDHNLTILGGFTTYYYGYFGRTGTAKQRTTPGALPIPDDKRFWYVTTGFEDPSNTIATSGQTTATTVSELGRVMYNYKNKYYLNASVRNDASSRLLPANQNQVFWAVGGAWDVSKENFMSNVHGIDYLKIKGSVGVLGNQSAIDNNGNDIAYPAYPYVTTSASSSANFGTNVYAAPQLSYDANPDLKWETVSSQEVGFELNAFKNQLHFEANYFNKKTNDLIVYVPRNAPLLNELENSGSLRNWGEEITAGWSQNINKDFSINFGGNITFLQNKMLSLSPDFPLLNADQGGSPFISKTSQNNGSAESRSAVGHPIGSYYGYVVDGLYQSNLDILKSPSASSLGSYRPGDFKFRDTNGDGVITAADRTFIGNPTPKFTYGAYVNLNYKSFGLSIDVGGVYGNQIFRTWGSLESPFQRVNYPLFKLDRWHGAGTSNWEPIISQADRFNYNGSTYNLEDGSYVRIRNVQLSYAFGKPLLGKTGIKAARIFVNVQNLKTWQHTHGYTPEHGGTATYFGYDYGDGAIPMVATAGLNVTF
jgi:TonB-linked SusC/RagA family outer membrane protein